MQILFLSRWFPFPPDNGSKLRINNLLRALAQCHQVTLLSFTEKEGDLKGSSIANDYCEEIRSVGWKPFDPKSQRAILGYFSLKPRSFIDTYSFRMGTLIKETLEKKHIDLIIASQVDMAAYYEIFRGYPALFEEVEISAFYQKYISAKQPLERCRHGVMWWKYKKFITRSMDSFNYCTVVSEPEKQLLVKIGVPEGKIKVIPNHIDLDGRSNSMDTPERNSLIFPGSILFYANYDAVSWFLEEILPIILNRLPDVHFKITGEHHGLLLPSKENVILTGYVEDVKPLIARSWISLAPIRLGGGTRMKILEAMALRTPVVSTTKGAEGLDVQDNVHLLIADTPEKYADCIIRLLKDPHLRKRIGDNAYNLVKEKYDWAVVMPHFLKFVEGLVLSD
jgi:polysaccharide biosynthesis protein PslH